MRANIHVYKSVKAYLVANKFHCSERGKQIAGKVFLMENRTINRQFKKYIGSVYAYVNRDQIFSIPNIMRNK